jgi:hypothetical protein
MIKYTAKTIAILLLSTGISYAIPPTDVSGPSAGELKFNGTIAESCNLQKFTDGTVVSNLTQTEVSSLLSGGAAATVTVRSNVNGFTLVIGSPQLFGPNGELTDVTFNLDPVGTGARLDGTSVSQFGPSNGVMSFDSGIYDISMNATASRNAGAFEAGTYQLKVPVSCVKSA